MSKYFQKIVGLKNATSKLSFFLDGFAKTNIFPNCIFLAQRGSGKTTLAKETCREMFLIRKKNKVSRPMVEINCSGISNIEEFLNRVILPFVGKECSFVLDECSGLHKKIVMILLTMLNPNSEEQNKITFNGEEILIDFRKWTFLFCTTMPQLVHQDLRDRLEEINLEAYSYENLATIIKNSLTCKIEDSVCLEIAPFCRGNARSATKISKKIISYLEVNNKNEFTSKDVPALMKLIDCYPLGLTRTEIDLLTFLSKQEDMSLNGLVARSGLEKSAIQNFERYLTKHDLLSIKNKRMITAKGQQYLNDIKELIN